MKIGTRLGAGFALVLLLLIVVTVLGVSHMAGIKAKLDTITLVNNVESKQAIIMRVTVYDRMLALRNLALLSDPAEMAPEVERIRMQADVYKDAEQKLARIFDSDAGTTAEEKAMLARVREVEAAALPAMAKAAELGLANKQEEATRALIQEVRPLQKRWIGELNDLVAFEENLTDKAVAAAGQQYDAARTRMFAVSALALAAGCLIAWAITVSITRPLREAVAVARTVAAGDLTSHIEVTSTDEAGELLQSLKDMNDGLVRIVGEVRRGTDTIASATLQISGGNLELSSRTEQQASSLEETASSMEELTSTVKQNADNAYQANQLAASASEVATRGGVVVAQVVQTMAAINESARKIADIISVIDGIAFQTNILALNAAVEAARAGEEGRGFAVVASEVRSLAQRSAAAAKEINTLISDSVEKVDAGAKLVDEAGVTMDEIVTSVQRVTGIMTEITEASREQSSGIEQINQAVVQMDEVTQQNAGLVEEAAAAAEALHGQAGRLAEVVSVFKLDLTNAVPDNVIPLPRKPPAPAKALPDRQAGA